MRFFRKKSDGYKKITKKMLEHLHCECTVFPIESKCSEVEEAYFRALQLGKSEGFIPIFIVPSEMLLEDIIREEDMNQVMASSLEDGKSVLKRRWDEELEAEEELVSVMEEKDSIQGESNNHFLTEEVRNNRLIEEVILAKIPVKHPWEIFMRLPIGGWNGCPEPKEFMSVTKYWYELYGAVPVTLTYSSLEYYLENPIQDSEEASQVAQEHFAFCEDRVYQCTVSGTLKELENDILNSKVWYFWWD